MRTILNFDTQQRATADQILQVSALRPGAAQSSGAAHSMPGLGCVRLLQPLLLPPPLPVFSPRRVLSVHAACLLQCSTLRPCLKCLHRINSAAPVAAGARRGA